ncbi:MAG: hypothetical protein VKQ33_07560 [Candidatus Sericytochromatia bacterium]|nr:hypothetical protein [Candidatus Sericytochromatia bacterium]
MAHRQLGLGGMLLTLALAAPSALASTPASRPLPQQPPADRHGEARGRHQPGYNFPPPSRGDRFARRGLNLKVGIRGWRRFGPLIKKVARAHGVDPFVVGAYIWVESEFDPRQDYVRGPRRAIGLGSVQATDHPGLSVAALMEPRRNVELTVREFADKWRPNDMRGTVMDVWYPAWRRMVAVGRPLPVIRTPGVYVQAIANRYYALREIDQHLRPTQRAAGTARRSAAS